MLTTSKDLNKTAIFCQQCQQISRYDRIEMMGKMLFIKSGGHFCEYVAGLEIISVIVPGVEVFGNSV